MSHNRGYVKPAPLGLSSAPTSSQAGAAESKFLSLSLTLKITRQDGSVEEVSVRCRIDTPIEIDYYQHGGI